MDIALRTEIALAEDHSWLGSAETLENPESGTLDVSTFTSGTHYPNGFVPSGMALAKLGNGKWGPYSGAAGVDEVQTISRTSTGGTVTLTYDGETTAATAIVAATTAAQVKAALETLPNVNPGDVTVTGPAGGPWPVTFVGAEDDVNVPAITVDNTNATGGTVTIAQTTSGAAGTGTDFAHLATSTRVQVADPTIDVGCALVTDGTVREANLPANHGVDEDFKALMSTAGRSVRYI